MGGWEVQVELSSTHTLIFISKYSLFWRSIVFEQNLILFHPVILFMVLDQQSQFNFYYYCITKK